MFRTVPLSIIRSFSLYTQQWYMSYTFADSLRAGSGWNISCQQTCMTYTIAVCTVKNSWWWTEELSETCRVLLQNKFEKLVHLVGFIIWSWYHCCCARFEKEKIGCTCYRNRCLTSFLGMTLSDVMLNGSDIWLFMSIILSYRVGHISS